MKDSYNPARDICNRCIYWRSMPQCRRHAPILDHRGDVVFPIRGPSDTCGDFEPVEVQITISFQNDFVDRDH